MNEEHGKFLSKVELAGTYLDDGALFSAARVLRELADELERIGKKRNDEMQLNLI